MADTDMRQAISKIDAKHPAHYYELRIDTKTNQPQILNGKGLND